MKKLTCHCGGIQAEVNVPENGFEKVMRCNCSICKRKGYIIGAVYYTHLTLPTTPYV